MRKLILFPLMALAMAACNEKKSAPSGPISVTDLAQDRMKGNVTQVETDTYLVDSATGKMGKLDEKEITVYDDKGYVKTYTKKNGKDSLLSEMTLTLDANGFVTKQVTNNGKGKLKTKVEITVDSAGKVSSAKRYDSTDKMVAYYTDITQNKYLLLTGAKEYHQDSTLKQTFINDYDSIYYVGGTGIDSVGKPNYTGKVKLDDKKNEIAFDETTVEKGVSKTTTVTYKYDTWDDKGNWTKQTTLNEKGKPTKIKQRIITYKP
jgi:hypothetical protein